uniref:Uncharacterized protein n=1 Tax=Glossina brevipalpis TaxID=37001 RepID=A0A1A9WTW6_9MUSC
MMELSHFHCQIIIASNGSVRSALLLLVIVVVVVGFYNNLRLKHAMTYDDKCSWRDMLIYLASQTRAFNDIQVITKVYNLKILCKCNSGNNDTTNTDTNTDSDTDTRE